MPFPYDQVDDATMLDDAKGLEHVVVYLRDVHAGEGDECWVVCNKVDPGAVKFIPA